MEHVTLIVVSILLFVGMLGLAEFGRSLARRRGRIDEDSVHEGTGVVEGAIFALLGLLLAFHTAGAAGRIQLRRELAVREANAIGTVNLRLDLLEASHRDELRTLLRRNIDDRIRGRAALPDLVAARRDFEEVERVQQEIWDKAVVATATRGDATRLLLLPALNEMIDLTTSGIVAVQTHTALPMLVLLFTVALISAALAGFSMARSPRRQILHTVLFAAVASLVIYVCLDLEFPRTGLIRIGAADQALHDLRATLGD